MDLQSASWLTLVAPALVVAGLVVVLPGLLPMTRPWARGIVAGTVMVVMARYLWWRATETLILADGAASVWSVFCFAVELAASLDAAILFLTLSRTSDRSGEADRSEAAWRGADPTSAPKVDVLICTYNEPLAVLEKTIVGALSMEWPNLAVYVLDDGRRPWLRDFCQKKGVGYITRPDNKGAKAGNINHALGVTDGAFVAIFDADFVPQRKFLMRTMGFFDDPKIGIVQTPHAFYNHDPMQSNLGMRRSLPDDQRFFFECIMPSRDGWNAAFCCGSNSVTRREALELAGGGLPEGSITEDMLLSLVLLQKGFITRYLNERLAYGLAPETVSAFFVQRQRWARGAMQILFLRSGPLGPGHRPIQRLLFLPTHWLTQSLMTVVSLLAPVIFLLTGVAPMQNTALESATFYLAPLLIAVFGGLVTFAPRKYNPLAAQVLSSFQSIKLLPTILLTLVRPHGHVFKVTPKGANAATGYERGIFLASLTLILLYAVGVGLSLSPEFRRIDNLALVPLVAGWCAFNTIVLFLVSLICLQIPVRRQEERFGLEEPVILRSANNAAPATFISEDMSLSGAGLRADGDERWAANAPVEAFVSGVGWIPGRIARASPDLLGVEFHHEDKVERDLLIRKLFTMGRDTVTESNGGWRTTAALIKRIWTADMRLPKAAAFIEPAPSGPAELLEARTLVLPPAPRSPIQEPTPDPLERAA